MYKYLLILFVLLFAVLGVWFFQSQESPSFLNVVGNEMNNENLEFRQETSRHFEKRLKELANRSTGISLEDFDAPSLRALFSGLSSSDFQGVETHGGHYENKDGTLSFVADSGPRSGVRTLSEDGYGTLFGNLIERFGLDVSKESADQIMVFIHTKTHLLANIGAQVGGFGIYITPREILEDSRCPIGVNCIQAGTVRVSTIFSDQLSEYERRFTLGETAHVGGVEITLVHVAPDPVAGVPITSLEYAFTFELKKVTRDGENFFP